MKSLRYLGLGVFTLAVVALVVPAVPPLKRVAHHIQAVNSVTHLEFALPASNAVPAR